MINDAAARQQALGANRSFIVQAPAGSGKTGLLVYRLLTLLARVEKPQQVLSITFTRKATAEMRERVLHLLNIAHEGGRSDDSFEQQGIDLAAAVLAQDARHAWNLLATPHQLQILTIDSFCAKLTGSMPWLSRLGDRPRTTDNAEPHYAAAVEQLLSELLDPASKHLASLQTVMLQLDFNYSKARQLFSAMLAKRDQWLRHLLQNELSSARAELQAAWSGIVTAQIKAVQNRLGVDDARALCELAATVAAEIRNKPSSLSALAIFEDWRPEAKLSLAHWKALVTMLLTNSNSFRKRYTKAEGLVSKSDCVADLKAFISTHEDEEFLNVLVTLRDLPEPTFSETDWQQLMALEQVLTSLAALLQLRFRAVGECDHPEVTQRANLALQELENPTDLSLRLDYHLQHILVDEFQDTSNGQVELLKKLTAGWTPGDGKTLFLVGDPMQSIYRFREADVSLFLQAADNQRTGLFDNIEIHSVALSTNFRSSESLVRWFNQTFADSFPAQSNVLDGAIPYASATSANDNHTPAVGYSLAYDKEQEADLLLLTVRNALDALPTPDDQVAILVRSRSTLDDLLPRLQRARIPYAGVEIQLLSELQAVIDVLALCKAICREDDRVAWLALLRGPWCGLTLTEIKHVAGSLESTVWQQLEQADICTLSASSVQRLRRFIGVMRSTRAQRQQVSLSSLTRWAWLHLGGVDTLFDATRDDIETVFDLIERLQRGGDLPSIRELDKALEKLYAQPTTQHARLVVSTMHKAKGLQYHTVILPALARGSRSSNKEVLMWAEYQSDVGDSSLLLAPLTFEPEAGSHYQYLRELDRQRAANELARLMYVACTRAESRLELLASLAFNDKTGEPQKPSKGTLLATIWETLADNFQYRGDAPETMTSAGELDQTLFRLPPTYTPAFDAAVDWKVTQQLITQPEPEQQEVEYDWATEVATGVGIVLHDWLQYSGGAVLSIQVDASLKARWRAELRGLRVPENRLEAAVGRIEKAVTNIHADTDAHFLFQDYPEMRNEYALSAFENGSVNRYRIDRTFVDEQGVRWVVDYKSTDTNNANIDSFVDEQVATRHRAQLQKYGELLSQIDDRPIKLAVYFPLLRQLRAWDFQQ